jgi:hypothetical protein
MEDRVLAFPANEALIIKSALQKVLSFLDSHSTISLHHQVGNRRLGARL